MGGDFHGEMSQHGDESWGQTPKDGRFSMLIGSDRANENETSKLGGAHFF